MSGRLIILPKKSYCPWNSKNVERVLRDEREHAEATAKEAKDQEKSASLARIDALKNNNNNNNNKRKLELSASGDDNPIERRPQHVNLFALEEAEHQKRLETVMEPSKQQKNHGVVPLYLGHSVNESAFYLKSAPSSRKADEKGDYAVKREEERKDKMDPMRAFFGSSSEKLNSAPNRHHHHHEPMNSTMRSKTTKDGHSRRERRGRDRAEDKGGSRTHAADASTPSSSSTTSTSSKDDSSMQRRNRRRHKRSRSKKHGRSRSKSTNGESSIDELRRRRAEREEAERHRQSEVIQASRDVRFSGYQNQYHPGLSRK